MRLEHDDRALIVERIHGIEQRAQLTRMVCIIVIDVCAVIRPLELQPPARTVERSERRLHIRAGNAKLPCHRARGQRVHRVVPPEHAEVRMAIKRSAAIDVKLAEIRREVFAADVVRLREAEAHVVHAAQRVSGIGVVTVRHDQSARRDKRGKRAERMFHVGQILEKVEMVGVDVENDRRRREKSSGTNCSIRSSPE